MKTVKRRRLQHPWREEVVATMVACPYGIARDVAYIIASYLPTFAEELAHRLEGLNAQRPRRIWPEVSAATAGPDEEFFCIWQSFWFQHLDFDFQRMRRTLGEHDEPANGLENGTDAAMAASRAPYLAFAAFILQVLDSAPVWGPMTASPDATPPVSFLVPEVTLTERRMRVLFHDRDLLVITFPIPLTLEEAYERFNNRLALFLEDLLTYAPNDSLVAAASFYLQKTHYHSPEAFAFISRTLANLESRINARDASMFSRPFEPQNLQLSSLQFGIGNDTSQVAWRVWARAGTADVSSLVHDMNDHADAIWKFANAQVKEAIWRAVEDLLDLSNDVRHILLVNN